jgi:adenosylcobinamide-GDP ribazoletransferase
VIRGAALALSWLTVLPVEASDVDRRTARAAITFAPVVGLLLGAVAAGIGYGATLLGAPALLAGLLAVAALALSTRGMHVDGFADTVDGLGCYGPPERALAVMRDGGAGPFAVIALIITVGAQAVCIGALATGDRWPLVVIAVAAGRAAFVSVCRRGVPAARPDGLGALVAGSQHVVVGAAWWLVLAAAAAVVTPWAALGPVIAAVVVEPLVRHVVRRFGGVSGDVLGASSELAVTVTLVVFVLTAHL